MTLLAFDDRHGKQVLGVLDLKYFDRPYRDLAEKIIDFRGRYKKPPGVAHIDDLFDAMLERGNPDQRRQVKDLLGSMVQQHRTLNSEFVAGRVTEFIRRQTLKDGVIRAGERIGQGGANTDDEVAEILEKALKSRVETMHSGTFLDDADMALTFLDHPAESFRWGIPALDKRQLGPTRKEVLMYIAARKRGKTWAMTHLGKQGVVEGYKTCHISLEMSEAKIAQRYLQSMFAAAKRKDRNLITRLEMDDFGNIEKLVKDHQAPRYNFEDPDIRSKLYARIKQSGMKFGNLVIKDFPSGTLTIGRLNSYLDRLADQEGFIPDMIIIDYPRLMKIGKPEHLRIELGQLFVDIRGIAVERNAALICPHQGNRDATTAKEVDETNASEDISTVATSDTVITYSQTKAEKSLKLARLTVTNARNDEDGLCVLITQNYATGQFCLSSAMVTSRYEMALREAIGNVPVDDMED